MPVRNPWVNPSWVYPWVIFGQPMIKPIPTVWVWVYLWVWVWVQPEIPQGIPTLCPRSFWLACWLTEPGKDQEPIREVKPAQFRLCFESVFFFLWLGRDAEWNAEMPLQ